MATKLDLCGVLLCSGCRDSVKDEDRKTGQQANVHGLGAWKWVGVFDRFEDFG